MNDINPFEKDDTLRKYEEIEEKESSAGHNLDYIILMLLTFKSGIVYGIGAWCGLIFAGGMIFETLRVILFT